MTETLANGYSSESTQRELSNEYQHDRVSMVFRHLGVLELWMIVALALEGLSTVSTAGAQKMPLACMCLGKMDAPTWLSHICYLLFL